MSLFVRRVSLLLMARQIKHAPEDTSTLTENTKAPWGTPRTGERQGLSGGVVQQLGVPWLPRCLQTPWGFPVAQSAVAGSVSGTGHLVLKGQLPAQWVAPPGMTKCVNLSISESVMPSLEEQGLKFPEKGNPFGTRAELAGEKLSRGKWQQGINDR